MSAWAGAFLSALATLVTVSAPAARARTGVAMSISRRVRPFGMACFMALRSCVMGGGTAWPWFRAQRNHSQSPGPQTGNLCEPLEARQGRLWGEIPCVSAGQTHRHGRAWPGHAEWPPTRRLSTELSTAIHNPKHNHVTDADLAPRPAGSLRWGVRRPCTPAGGLGRLY